ncbi:hypothetical protein DAPK24_008090 [Pichia kluyveri]|uniref:Uncharacterized protein n=1 Tax=Pichia kluyveri TaxID=36015 RepID=A0AAV5QYI7_PICKL|nr:hypothetical protein DAPK24_008090 [Pichia kluyveri]
MQLSLKLYLVTIFCLLSLVFADVSATTEIDTSTSETEVEIETEIGIVEQKSCMTKPQAILLLTAGVAYESGTLLDVYERCYSLSGRYVNGEDCFYAIKGATIRWCVELYAMDVIRGWCKNNVDDVDDVDDVDESCDSEDSADIYASATTDTSTTTTKNKTNIIDLIKNRLYTKTRAVMLLTAVIVHETGTAFDLYKRCYIHSGHYISGEDCFYAVREATIRWSVELLALNVINDWSKEDLGKLAKDESGKINHAWYSSFLNWYNYIL